MKLQRDGNICPKEYGEEVEGSRLGKGESSSSLPAPHLQTLPAPHLQTVHPGTGHHMESRSGRKSMDWD